MIEFNGRVAPWFLLSSIYFVIFQKLTCQLLEDTVKCDELLSRCHSAEEVEKMKNAHISARINQYNDNKVCQINRMKFIISNLFSKDKIMERYFIMCSLFIGWYKHNGMPISQRIHWVWCGWRNRFYNCWRLHTWSGM